MDISKRISLLGALDRSFAKMSAKAQHDLLWKAEIESLPPIPTTSTTVEWKAGRDGCTLRTDGSTAYKVIDIGKIRVELAAGDRIALGFIDVRIRAYNNKDNEIFLNPELFYVLSGKPKSKIYRYALASRVQLKYYGFIMSDHFSDGARTVTRDIAGVRVTDGPDLLSRTEARTAFGKVRPSMIKAASSISERYMMPGPLPAGSH
jgi:hypothetical protein